MMSIPHYNTIEQTVASGTASRTLIDETVTITDTFGHGSPEGAIAANVGSIYHDDDSGATYWKATGTGNTGWVTSPLFVATTAPSLVANQVFFKHDPANPEESGVYFSDGAGGVTWIACCSASSKPVVQAIEDSTQDIGVAVSIQAVNIGYDVGTVWTATGTAGLPPGVSIDAAGLLSGTVTAGSEGCYTIFITATNPANGDFDVEEFILCITGPNPVASAEAYCIDNTTIEFLDASTPGDGNTITLQRWTVDLLDQGPEQVIIEGVPGAAATVVSDTRGTTVLADIGVSITGNVENITIDTAAEFWWGDLNVTVYVEDSGGGSASYLIPSCTTKPNPPVVTAVADQAATTGNVFTFVMANTGGVGTWSVTSGTLPNGLTLNASTGEISGTPTVGGTQTVTVSAVNTDGSDSATFDIIVAANPPVLSSTDQTGDTTTGFSYFTTNTGGPVVTYTVDVLPPGLTINATTGEISGTPTATGVTTVTVTGTNADGSSSDSFDITITVNTVAGGHAFIFVITDV